MIENIHWGQAQLAERWQVSEATLERWRFEGIGPIYLKLMGAYEARALSFERYQCL